MAAEVVAVHRSETHNFSKPTVGHIRLGAGIGVDGDAHAGPTIRHRGRLPEGAQLPNLRQVHLIAAELYDDLRAEGFDVSAGELGENVTTRGVALGGLPTGTALRLGDRALVVLTGIRTPCVQIDRFRNGLLDTVRRCGGAGVMGVVVSDGVVRAGDRLVAQLPPPPHATLGRV